MDLTRLDSHTFSLMLRTYSYSFSFCMQYRLYVYLLSSSLYQVRDKDYGFQKSTTKKGDVNPVWDETFTFNIPTLNNMVLSLKVFDDDVGSRDDKCGRTKIHLEKEDITASPTCIEKTIDRNLLRKNGKIVVEISYTE